MLEKKYIAPGVIKPYRSLKLEFNDLLSIVSERNAQLHKKNQITLVFNLIFET